MSSVLYTDIASLVTNDESLESGILGELTDAALIVENGHISWVGQAKSAPAADHQISLDGKSVIPGFVDSHAHLVFAGNRAAEFAARMNGENIVPVGSETRLVLLEPQVMKSLMKT